MSNKEENKKNNPQNNNQDIKNSKANILNTKKEFNIFSLINMTLKKYKISTFIIFATLSLIQKNRNPSGTFFRLSQKYFATEAEKKVLPKTLPSMINFFCSEDNLLKT